MKTMHSFFLIAAMFSSFACSGAAAPETQETAAPSIQTEEQKTLYALGLALSGSITQFNLSSDELALVQAGLTDGVLDRTHRVNLEEYRPKLNDLAQSRASAGAQGEKDKGRAFLEAAAAEEGAETLPSGVVYMEIQAGSGESPKPTDTVKVHYHGTLIDGTVFDSSVDRGEPIEFPLNGVIPCWTEAVQKMKVGGKSKLVCPSDRAYGDRGAGAKIKPGATLVFEVELLGIK